MAPGVKVYGEKLVAEKPQHGSEEEEKLEYRIWNVYRSKLGAGIAGGVRSIYMQPGSRVLYLGAASGTTVSHVSDLVGEKGMVYAV